MECGAPTVLDTLVKRFTNTDPASLCSVVLIGGSDPMTNSVDCVNTNLTSLELFVRSLTNSDAVIGVDVTSGTADDIEPLTCAEMGGLETLFRRVLLIGDGRTKLKVFRTGEMFAQCMGCDDVRARTPLLERVLGTVVRVGGEYMVRVEGVDGSFPSMVPIDCNTSGVSSMAMLAGAISYDATTRTWFWNTVEI